MKCSYVSCMYYLSAFYGGYESASPLQHLQPASGHDITPQSLLGATSTQQVENVIELDEGIVIIVCAVLALTLHFSSSLYYFLVPNGQTHSLRGTY